MHDDSEQRAAQLLEAHNKMSERWRDENRSTVSQFQKSLQELKEENTQLVALNTEFESKISQLITERDELTLNLETQNHVSFWFFLFFCLFVVCFFFQKKNKHKTNKHREIAIVKMKQAT